MYQEEGTADKDHGVVNSLSDREKKEGRIEERVMLVGNAGRREESVILGLIRWELTS